MRKSLLLFLIVICLPIRSLTQVLDSVSINIFDSLLIKAQAMMTQKDFSSALIKLSEAEKLLLEKNGVETVQFGDVRFLQGRVAYLKRDFPQAEANYNDSKKIREKLLGKMHPEYTKCIMSIGVLYYVQGKFMQAEPYFLEGKLNYEKTVGTENLDYAKCMNNLAGIYNEQGYYEKAEAYFKKSKELWESKAPEHPNYPISINSLAVLYTNIGDYKKSELLYIQAIEVRKKMLGENHQDYATSLSNLGVLYAFMRNFDKAEKLILQALQIKEKLFGKRSEAYATDLNNLALLYKQMGREEDLEKSFLEAMSIWEETSGKETARFATILKNLGAFHLEKKNYSRADSLFRIALPIYEKVIGKSHQDYANVLSYLGFIEAETGHFAEPEKYFLDAKNIMETSLGTKNEYFTHYLIALFQLYWKYGNFNSATPYLVQALHNDMNSLNTASTHLSERELSSFISDFSRRISFAFSYIMHSEDLTAECYDDILFFKGFLLNSGSQLKNYANSDTISSENFNQLRAVHRLLATEYSKPIASRSHVAELEEKANSLEKSLIRNSRQYSTAKNQVSWNQVCNKLNFGEAAIEFVHYNLFNPAPNDSILYAALILKKGDKSPKFISLFEEGELSSLLQYNSVKKADYVNSLYNISDRGASVHKNSAKSLYGLIWKPLEKDLAGVNKIYFSPSGLLHRLNMDAVPVDQDLILSEKYQLIELNSTRQLVFPHINDVKNNLAVLYGGLLFDFDSTLSNDELQYASRNELSNTTDISASRSGSWNYLLGTEREINSLEKIMRSVGLEVDTKKGFNGTEDSFKRIAKNSSGSPRILHLATHGYFFPDQVKAEKNRVVYDSATSWKNKSDSLVQVAANTASLNTKVEAETNEPVFKNSENPMMRSGLIMAGGNPAWLGKETIEDKEDGILTAYEISQMNLSNTELVVLSACETGLGDLQGHEGVYGLQRAFKIAGAKYLIMSLWQVPDKQTSLLMTAFYKKWLEEKMTIPAAFQSAQKQLRDNGLDPYNWAGFVLVE